MNIFTKIRFTAVTVVLSCAAALAQDTKVDPVQTVTKARESFDAAMDKARGRLEADLNKRIDVAKKTGRVDVVDELTAERDRYLAEGALPGSSLVAAEVRSFRSAWRLAARALLATMQNAEQALTRADRLNEARQLHQERTVLESELAQDNPTPPAPSSDPADAFQANTVWKGFMTGVGVTNGERNVRHVELVLRVTERNGDWFKGTLGGPRGNAVEIEGSLGKINKAPSASTRDISFHFVRMLVPGKGQAAVGPATTHNGRIRGGYMEGNGAPHMVGNQRRASQFELNLQEGSTP